MLPRGLPGDRWMLWWTVAVSKRIAGCDVSVINIANKCFFLCWGGIFILCLVIKNARKMLILIAALSTLLFFIAFIFSLWQQPAGFNRIDVMLLFCGLFLLLTLGCVAKLSATQKSGRSGYERSVTE